MPLVTIGLPVYNGGRFLKSSIESILAQTFSDFELIISDNASTDDTEDICRAYAKMDRRILYARRQTNLGASRNFNDVFLISRGKYFKWASNDDICEPRFIEECVRVLEADSYTVLCYPRTKRIDEDGRVTGTYDLRLDTGSADPVTRFRELLLVKHACFQVFGVFRRRVLASTMLLNNHTGSDRVLLGEVSLHGRFHEITEYLFRRRSHAGESRLLFPDSNERVEWFDPSKKGKLVFSQWRLLIEYYNAVQRSPISSREKLHCCMMIAKWAKEHWRFFGHDIKAAGRRVMHKRVVMNAVKVK